MARAAEPPPFPWAPVRYLIVIVALVIVFPALAVDAQPAGKVFQIGYVGNATPTLEAALVDGLRQGLRERGYEEGKNVVLHYRWAEGRIEPMDALVADLLRLKVDVMVTSGTPAALAAKRGTTTVPIVMAAVGDAVGSGLVSSLPKPGGNITGLSTLYPELEAKRLEILREMLPKARRFSVLMNPANPFTKLPWAAVQAAASAAKVTLLPVEVSTEDEFPRAFGAIVKTKPDALIVLADRPFLFSHRARIAVFAAQQKLAAMYPFPEFLDVGGLAIFGPNFADMFRRSATYIDKIFKGAKPADLPVEQPLKFDLLLNQKTAKAIGLTIPHKVLLRADRVVE
jgi:putative ABC transport system substrate-binding protein